MDENAGDAGREPLRILMVEDVPVDAELAERQLRKSGLAFVSKRVETREDYLAALEEFDPGLILSDYSLPRFDGMTALLLAKEFKPGVPVIVITGSVNEETAVECMKAGADDYVLKDHIGRLGTAVRSALDKRRYQAETRAAEQALWESETRLRTFLNATTDIVFLKDDQRRYLFTNRANTLFIGKPEEQILGATDEELFPEGMAEACRASDLLAVERMDAVVSVEVAEGRHFQTLKFPVDLEGGRTGVGGFIRDMTTEMLAKEALRESESRYRLLFERNLAGVYRSTLEGRILDCNDAFARMFGFQTREEMGDLSAHALYENDSDREIFLARLSKEGSVTNYEEALKRRDGSPLWVLENVNLVGASGERVIEGTVMDITDWRQGQSQLLLLNAAIGQAHDAVVVADPGGDILFVNPAFERITGYGREEVLGQNPRLLKSGVQDQPFYERLWATIRAGETWSGRLVNRRKDGSLFTDHTIISPILDGAGDITAFVALKRDVTQEVGLERQLAEARTLETIGMIAGGVAHEVRNPLFAISTVVAALDKKLGRSAEYKEYMDHINEHVRRLSQLMDDLLALGRPVDRAQFTPLDLGAVVEAAGREVCGAHPEWEGRLRVEAQGALAVRGLEPKLRQVFTNIVQNAFHFSPPEGAVEVTLGREGAHAVVTVADHGPGIPAEMMPKLFEPFQSRRQGGTGLGLAIVRKILTAHGGAVEGANRTDGSGAVFTVRLPLGESQK